MTAVNHLSVCRLEPESWNANFRQSLIQVTLSKINDYHVAEDIVQETFVAAWKARDRFRGDCSEKTFLTGILRNKIIDFYRSKGRRPLVFASQMDHEDSDSSSGWMDNLADHRKDLHPLVNLEKQDFLNDLNYAVDRLPGKMGKAYRLWEIDDLSTDEVTRRLNITTSNLWVLVHRAKKALKVDLGAEWGEADFDSCKSES